MRYMGLLRTDKSASKPVPSSPEFLQRVGQIMEDIDAADLLAACNCEQAAARGARVRLSGGELMVSEACPAPAGESAAASYAMFDVQSIVEAIEWTMSFLKALGEGECEIRPVFGPQDLAIA
jgi:hypothetical protein